MGYPVSGCAFIRNNQEGAFCLWESMASMLPLVDEFVVMDLGSTDGTLEMLETLTKRNGRVRLVRGSFPQADASAFATLANDLIDLCRHDVVWYCQADEVPHENLLRLVEAAFERGEFDWTLWRIQYHNNFQYVKWFPHPVHRIGVKGRFHFVGDGMSTDRTWDAPVLGDYDFSWFSRWGELGQEGIKPYVDQMLLDVSLIGGFRDNVPARRALHAPFWHESPDIPYKMPGQEGQTWMSPVKWMEKARSDPDWTRAESPYNLPAIMRWHVGHTRYWVRQDLFEALCRDDTRSLVFGGG